MHYCALLCIIVHYYAWSMIHDVDSYAFGGLLDATGAVV